MPCTTNQAIGRLDFKAKTQGNSDQDVARGPVGLAGLDAVKVGDVYAAARAELLVGQTVLGAQPLEALL